MDNRIIDWLPDGFVEEGKPRIPAKIQAKADEIKKKLEDGTPPGEIPNTKPLKYKKGRDVFSIALPQEWRLVYYKSDGKTLIMSHETYNKWLNK